MAYCKDTFIMFKRFMANKTGYFRQGTVMGYDAGFGGAVKFTNTIIVRASCLVFVAVQLSAPLLFSEEKNDAVHYRLGLKYKNECKYQQAAEEFNKVLTAYPDHYNAYMHLAEIAELQSRYRLAIVYVKKSLAYNPGWGKAKKMLASLYEKDNQVQNAMREYQDYVQICDPAERDSIQGQIDRLIASIKGSAAGDQAAVKQEMQRDGRKTGSGGLESAVSKDRKRPESAAQKQSLNKDEKKGGYRKEKSSDIERTFWVGVSLYSESMKNRNPKILDSSLSIMQQVLRLSPSHGGAWYYKGLIHYKKNRFKEAAAAFEKGIRFPELGANAYFYLGKIFGNGKHYSKAIQNMQQFIKKTDDMQLKREAEALLAHYGSALEAARAETLAVNPKEIIREELHKEISKVSQQEPSYKPFEIRIDSLLTMALVDTVTEPGQAMLTGIRSFNGLRFDEAIEAFQKVLLLYPNGDVAARCIYDVGVCYFKLRNFVSAEKKFQQVIDRFHNHTLIPQSLFLKSLCLFEMHEYTACERLLRSFLQKYPAHVWAGKAFEKLGDLYVRELDHNRAIEAFTKAEEKSGSANDKLFIMSKLGNEYQQVGNNKRALDIYQKALSIKQPVVNTEKTAEIHYRVADCHYQQKNYSKALEYYTAAVVKFPVYQDTPWGMFQIGSIYKNQKQYEKALKGFSDLMTRFPNDYWSRQARWKYDDTVWEHEYRSVLNSEKGE